MISHWLEVNQIHKLFAKKSIKATEMYLSTQSNEEKKVQVQQRVQISLENTFSQCLNIASPLVFSSNFIRYNYII